MEIDKFIKVTKNAFSHEFCDKVIKAFDYAHEHGFTVDRQKHDNAKKVEKEDNSFFIPNIDINHTSTEIAEEFRTIFWQVCYEAYANEFDILKSIDPHNIYTMKIQKTEPGQGFHAWHFETPSRHISNRILVWTVYLNDDFEAGETEFLYQQYRYKPNKGDVVIFPASFTHTHRGNPPIGGTKYIITGWVEF